MIKTDKTKTKTLATLEAGDTIFYGQGLYVVSSVIEGCGQIKITTQSYNDNYTIPRIFFSCQSIIATLRLP